MFRCYYIASVVDLCLLSSDERILTQHVVTPIDFIFTYIRTPRQPVSNRTGAAPVTSHGGPEMPTEQPMGETGPGMGVAVKEKSEEGKGPSNRQCVLSIRSVGLKLMMGSQ